MEMKGAVRQNKEIVHCMTKLSIDLNLPEGGIIGTEMLVSIAQGGLETLRNLGALAEMVEVFRVTWIRIPPNPSAGPRFAVYFRDPCGEKASYTIDYRHIGRGTVDPGASEIVEIFGGDDGLRKIISRHIGICRERLEGEQRLLARVLATGSPKHCISCGGSLTKGDGDFVCVGCGRRYLK